MYRGSAGPSLSEQRAGRRGGDQSGEPQQYVDGVDPLIERAGGRTHVVDPDVLVLEGDWRPSTLVVHELPNREAVQRFWDSPEYVPFKELRRRYSSVRVVVGGA